MGLTIGLELLGLFDGGHPHRGQNAADLNQGPRPLLAVGLLGLGLQGLLLGAELPDLLVEFGHALGQRFVGHAIPSFVPPPGCL